MSILTRSGLALALALSVTEVLASDPLTLANGRLTLGGELSGTLAPEDPGFFNYDDYDHSLRKLRVSLTAQAQAGEHVALLGEVLSENGGSPRVYALYLRVRPWKGRSFDLQAGVIPPVFGAFARRRYGSDNPLIGNPLAYQYLTSLRSDAVPATIDDLLRARGEGWLVFYPIGSSSLASGLPLVNALRWDTGVQARIGSEPIAMSVAVTQGTLSHPRVKDDNDGKQISARLAWQPAAGLVVGASGARGEYLAQEVSRALPSGGGRAYYQRAWGIDLEYSQGYWLLRGEAIWTEWDIPAVAAGLEGSLRATALMGEGRYKLLPGLYAAARIDHLGFGRITGAVGRLSWEAPVTRIEAGVGYSPLRNLLLKAAYQRNRRDPGRVRSDDLVAAQVVLWF